MSQLTIPSPVITGEFIIPADFLGEGARFLATAQEITAITKPEERDKAKNLSSDIKAHLDLLEKARETAKKPILDAGKQLDGSCKEHREPLEAQRIRLNRLNGAYEAEQERLREVQLRKLREEQEKAERERLALERKQAQEAAEHEKQARTPADEAKALGEALDAEDRQAELLKKQQELAAQEELARMSALKEKASGASLRTKLEIEITDIHELYKSAPQCVKLEPRKTEIEILINAGRCPRGVTYTRVPVLDTRR
jgi:hypothetical protein